MAEQIGKPTYRVGIMGGIVWLTIATVADLFTLIPFVGDFVGPIFWVCFSIYLWKIGCGFINARRLATEVVSAVGEMIPVVQELPLILAGVLVVLIMIRFEDKTGISVMPAKGKFGIAKKGSDGNYLNQGKTKELFNKGYGNPLNENGVRAPQTGNTYRPEQGGQTITANMSGAGRSFNVNGVRVPSQPRASVAGVSNTATAYSEPTFSKGPSTGYDAKNAFMSSQKGANPDKDLADAQAAYEKAKQSNVDVESSQHAYSERNMDEAYRNMQSAKENQRRKAELGDKAYATEHKANLESRWDEQNKREEGDGSIKMNTRRVGDGANTTNTSSSELGTDSSTGMEWSHAGIIRKMDSATGGRAGRLADKIGKVAGVDGSVAHSLATGEGIQAGTSKKELGDKMNP